MREAFELQNATEEYFARPLEDNIFEWHFTVHGSPGTEYSDGVYHGRILLPPDYPMKPPNIILLTPNGRFQTHSKICLNISGHHPETWQPSWSIRTTLLALIAFMSSPGQGSIGALDYTPEERRKLAKASQTWECELCGPIAKLLSSEASKPVTKDEEELVKRILLKAEEKEPSPETKDDKESSTVPNSEESKSDAPKCEDKTTAPTSPPPPAPTSHNLYSVPPDVSLVDSVASENHQMLIIFVIVIIGILIARRMAIMVYKSYEDKLT